MTLATAPDDLVGCTALVVGKQPSEVIAHNLFLVAQTYIDSY